MKSRPLLPAVIISSFVGVCFGIVACAPAEFSKDPETCENPAGGSCVVNPDGLKEYDYTLNTNSLPIDILVVSDNSGSMSLDQRSLGSKFPAFLNLVQSFDYHIAVTTTDVAGSGKAGRDGKLLDMGSKKFLTREMSNQQTLFQSAVQRPETATCDSYLQTHNCNIQSCDDYYNFCPSDDSRAIYAANLVVNKNEGGFLRQNAPLHVIILSNADERVLGGNAPNRPLEDKDQPSTLVQNVQATFGGTKQLMVHTIVIQPGDSSCLNQETFSSTVFGQYAPVYVQLSTMTGGVRGTICASDYTSQLTQIGTVATGNLKKDFPLNCKTSDTHLTYTLMPLPSPAPIGHVDGTGQVLSFTSPLPQNTQVHMHYVCEQ